MKPLNILYIVPYVPNLIRVRPYNLIRSLAERGHCVTVATLYGSEHERKDAEELRQHVTGVHAYPITLARSLMNAVLAIPRRVPFQSVYAWSPAFAQALVELAARENGKAFDVVHVEHLRGAHYGLHLKRALRSGTCPPVIWDSVDCITLLFRQAASGSKSLPKRLLTRLDLARTEMYEGWLARQFDHVAVTSHLDQKALAALMPSGSPISSISVLPNGVDLDYFTPNTGVARDPATLVISGKMSYHANVTMTLNLIENIMPIIWARRPDTRVIVVGKDPTREIQALAQNPNIEVTGTVDDIRPYLYRATAAVTPITYGTGIQNKVLEAMACATPVVSTPQAVSALRVAPGRDVLVAQEPLAFAEAVLGLLNDPQRQNEIGQAGRMYVESHHRWPEIAGQLEKIYQDAILRTQSAQSEDDWKGDLS